MKQFLKSVLALTIIGLFKVKTEELRTDNFLSNIGLTVLFWIVVFIFMDFREWVKK